MLSNIMSSAAPLLLFVIVWPLVIGSPVPLSPNVEQCAEKSMMLLKTLRTVLEDEKEYSLNNVEGGLFNGFNCSDLGVMVNDRSETVNACQPSESEDTGCSVQSKSEFSEGECLKNIKADLHHYETTLAAYKHANLSSIVKATQNTLKECGWRMTENPTSSNLLCQGEDRFEDRKCMCKVLKGFHLRTITINRALGYISAKHKK